MELYQDKKYIKLIEKVKAKLDKGLKDGLINNDKYGRTLNALITQPDKAFEEVATKYINDPVNIFVKKFKTREDTLLKAKQPITGTEGHHIFHQNTVKRLRKLPIQAQLEVMHKFRQLGGTSGVVPENITYLGRMSHRANLLVDKVREVTAHINPFNLKDDTTFWSKDYDFDLEKMSLDEIADALHNEAYGPQAMLAKQARLRKSEAATRKWFKQALGGTDIFDEKMPNVVRNKYKAVIQGLGYNYNDIQTAFEKGETPPLPNKGKVIPLVKALNENPNVISEGKIKKLAIKGGLFKTFTSAGRAFAGPEDLLDEAFLGNVGDAERRIKEGENPWTVAKEEGLDIAGELKDQALLSGAVLAGAKLTGTGAALGSVFNPLTTIPLLTYGAYRGVDQYLERSGKKGLTRRQANFFHMYETKDPETGLGTGKYEKDPEIEKKKWDNMRTYFENRNK
tara:strand:- start:381 stop:1739 length:1359 start_codon:yes stop_codon:yes gene_type:complete